MSKKFYFVEFALYLEVKAFLKIKDLKRLKSLNNLTNFPGQRIRLSDVKVNKSHLVMPNEHFSQFTVNRQPHVPHFFSGTATPENHRARSR